MPAQSRLTNSDVVQIGLRQRQVNSAILVGLLLVFARIAVQSTVQRETVQITVWVLLGLLAAQLVVYVLYVIAIHRMAAALRKPGPWIYTVVAMIPCLGLLAVLLLTPEASAILKQHGCPVGLLGVNQAELQRLSQRQPAPVIFDDTHESS
jgi:hypothetical protein